MQEEKAQVLLRFLVSLHENASEKVLFFMGDIFDLWLGDHKYFRKKFAPIVQAVDEFIQKGGQFHYFEGNHDLHLKKFWQYYLGGVVHPGPGVFLFHDKIIRIEHGDQMNPEDRGYLFLRWLLRTWFFKFLIMHLPGPIVSWIGDRASGLSRDYTDGLRDEEKIRKIIRDHAETIYDEKHFDFILSGHVHLKDEHHFTKEDKTVVSYNLGSWDYGYQALQLKNGQWSWLTLS